MNIKLKYEYNLSREGEKGGQWFSYYCYSLKGDFNE